MPTYQPEDLLTRCWVNLKGDIQCDNPVSAEGPGFCEQCRPYLTGETDVRRRRNGVPWRGRYG